jgi:hypothetical protein
MLSELNLEAIIKQLSESTSWGRAWNVNQAAWCGESRGFSFFRWLSCVSVGAACVRRSFRCAPPRPLPHFSARMSQPSGWIRHEREREIDSEECVCVWLSQSRRWQRCHIRRLSGSWVTSLISNLLRRRGFHSHFNKKELSASFQSQGETLSCCSLPFFTLYFPILN